MIATDVRLTVLYGLLAACQLPLWLKGAIRAVRVGSRWSAVSAYPVLYAGVYTALGLRGSLMAEWYLVPLLPLWIPFFLDGLRQALAGFRPRLRRLASLVLDAAMVACMVGGMNLGRDVPRPFLAPVVAWDERERLCAQVAGFLSPLLEDKDIVAASEIGALGHTCDCRILDTVGLVSPVSLRYYPISGDLPAFNAIPSDLVRDLVADYVVSLEVFMRPTLLQDDWFRENYRPILRLETHAFGSDGLLVYQRVP